MDNSITQLGRSMTTQTAQQLILVTGAARCGKSEWAESLAIDSGKVVTYIATATVDPTDTEWQARIDRHQQRRPANWQTISAVEDLASQIDLAAPTQCLLIDSLGTWVANLLDRSDLEWETLTQELLAVLPTSLATIVMVAEETGWGVVPAYPSGRLFRDRLGLLTRQIGSIASTVYLVTGGHVLNLSQLGQKLAGKS
ncbi:bifunctional adenosylcobinamide kinase/adenosylcobinamide-phosphate guanylyltransferase [Chamaesiphon sp. OTE_75_metabat_556]|uniref:bifunctional adenosylcobinamide kinase/adenosylcobinamide-phosphate guanylyltransferase n=1 Tax=Chamaesiphon sp. OTE_75_metabat_556 TaxID=2964692 RepID=UPI00286AAA3F|nr:bifunctional adenosylcobinamide kinase/adenosylcobinamide-phosphate guanylyltransferase [Chamaesiphon sp. OTE_75_metabat_556]